MTGMGRAPGGAMAMEDVGDLQRRAAHPPPGVRRPVLELLPSWPYQLAPQHFTRDPLPHADLILCRDGLVHLSFADIRAALRNFRRSGARWLLATTFIAHEHNDDIRTGGWRMLNLERLPFHLPPPATLIDERRPMPDGSDSGKRLGLWELGVQGGTG